MAEKIHCDICDSVCSRDRYRAERMALRRYLPVTGGWKTKDLCGDCHDAMSKLLRFMIDADIDAPELIELAKRGAKDE